MSKTDGVEVNVEMSKKPASMAELLESCGLQHRTRDFESEGYTIEISIDALKAGTLLEDLKELNLPLGERRMFVDQMEQLQKIIAQCDRLQFLLLLCERPLGGRCGCRY